MLLRYSDRACHAWITHGVIVEHASLSKSELICCALINRAAIKHTRCIGRDRMCGGVIVRPADRGAYLDHQRIGLKASTGDRHGIVGTSRSRSRGNYSPIRRRSLRRRRRMCGFDVFGRGARSARGRLFAAQ